eukprot:TRINITY_DN65699_c0_g1_i1.p1 TRINITY_DN65699_c0_g1~~TRINITY_DN65699_c0_g1_i1.p1  ORF type:complete len:323 (+),score=31.03 TRINITY_DN65699_c0_g1_i1:81-1049(+)
MVCARETSRALAKGIGVLLLLLSVRLDASTVSNTTGGADACPCLSGHDSLAPGLPAGHGIGCQFHDKYFPGCDSDDLATNCDAKWCYVNRSKCAVSSRPSKYFPHLDVSHATCGYFGPSHWNANLTGKTLKVMYMTNSGGWHGSYCKGTICKGPIVDIYQQVADEVGLHLSPQEGHDALVLQEASRRGLTKWETCYLATGMGFLDLCIAMFQMSETRSQLSTYITFRDKNRYLYILQTDQQKIDLLLVFAPFSAQAWITVICGAVLLSAMAMALEGHAPNLRIEGWHRKKLLRKGAACVSYVFDMFVAGLQHLFNTELPLKA